MMHRTGFARLLSASALTALALTGCSGAGGGTELKPGGGGLSS
jgi:nicotinamide mononucleotide (NMN) deamidase PncC